MRIFFVLGYDAHYPVANNIKYIVRTLEEAEEKCEEMAQNRCLPAPENIEIWVLDTETLKYTHFKDVK